MARTVALQVDPQFEISVLFASEGDGVLWAAVHGGNYHILSVSSTLCASFSSEQH